MPTGRLAVAQVLVTARSRPPVAFSTMRVGGQPWSRSTRVATPRRSLGTAPRSPAGRRAISREALATARPTTHGPSLMRTPVGPPLPRRAHGHQTPGRAWGVQDVTTHAPLRSRWTKAQSVYHSRGLRDEIFPRHLLKIQGGTAWRRPTRAAIPGA